MKMQKKILIYGTSMLGQQIKTYIEKDGLGIVEAFIADKEYINKTSLLGLPIEPFESIEKKYPKDHYQIALAFGYSDMNKLKEKKYNQCKKLNYDIFTLISSQAVVYSDDIAEGNLIFPGAIVAAGVKLGVCNCIEIGAKIGHHSQIGSFNFFSGNTIIGGDVKIKNNCFFGVSAMVADSATLEDSTLIAAGALLIKDSQKGQVFFPARTTIWHGTSEDIKIP